MPDQPNSADIRQFLFEFFNDDELTSLCFDYFPEVQDNFAGGMTKQQKILELLGYCQRREIVPNLLAAIQRARPEPYAKRFPQAPRAETRAAPIKSVRDPRQVFISHAHEDAEFAHQLADDLRHNGWRVWIAPDSIRPGEKWAKAINRGLEESSVFALVLTPAAVKSRWVMDETNVAIEYEHEGRMRFVPLMVEPCDVPPLWRAYQRISFQSDYGSGLVTLLDMLKPARRENTQVQLKAQKTGRGWILITRMGRWVILAREAGGRWIQALLRDPLWQGVGAIVAIAALAVALGTWLWPAIHPALFFPPALTGTATPTRTPALTAIAAHTVTPAPTPLPTSTFTPAPTATQTPAITPSPTPTLGISSTRISEKDGMVMVYVPAGEFLMGSSGSDQEAFSNEKPQRKVYLDAFWIDQTEVTYGQYQYCMRQGKCFSVVESKNTILKDYGFNVHYENCPVIYVTWYDAKSYCEWAMRRLPTEAEWEKAARGTDGRLYPWGNVAPNLNLLNYNMRVGSITEVGKLPAGASPFGVLDMAGNVWEWVADWYDERYYANPSAQTPNPQGPTSGQVRVLRGGSWSGTPGDARVANRGWNSPDFENNNVGFRCALSAPH